MAYTYREAIKTAYKYLNIDESKVEVIEYTNDRGIIYEFDGVQTVIFIYPISCKQNNKQNFFDTRDSGAKERIVAWNYAKEHDLRYFCLGFNEEQTRYKDYVLSLESDEESISNISFRKTEDSETTGTQVNIPNDFIPKQDFERIKTPKGFYISAIKKEYIREYIKVFDNRPYERTSFAVHNVGDINTKEYSIEALGSILKEMYNNAKSGMQKASIYIFALKYGCAIITKGYKPGEIVQAATLAQSYSTELNNALNIYRCLDGNSYGISIINGDVQNELAQKRKFDESIYDVKKALDERRNRIIFGAPGTGKSFKLNEDKDELLESGGDYERVTFHSNYSYANFVGSYKPVMVRNIGRQGLDDEKRRIVEILRDETMSAQEKYDILYDKFKDDGITRLPILLGIYTDENFKTRKVNGESAANDNDVERNHGRVIRKYLNLCDEIDDKKEISYEYVPGPFMRVLVKALKSAMTDNPKPYLLIVEEINRANPAAVFGDVFQLLDRDSNGVSEYSISTSQDMRTYLAQELKVAESEVETIKIPNNMFIWATMNSADQGVFPMDTAFKRRWDFEYLGIDEKEDKVKEYVIPVGNSDNRKYVYWNELRNAINDKLSSDECKINEDKLLGPFFISTKVLEKARGSKEQEDAFVKIFESKVLMYLFEDAMKMSPKKIFKSYAEKGGRMTFSKICEAFEKTGVEIFGLDVKVINELPKAE